MMWSKLLAVCMAIIQLWSCNRTLSDKCEVVPILTLQNMRDQNPHFIEKNIKVRGVVVSSDSYNNLFHTLYIQDHSAAMAVKLDMPDVFRVFGKWSVVELNCRGLYLNGAFGVCAVGCEGEDYAISDIPNIYIGDYLSVIDNVEMVIEPAQIEIKDLSKQYLGCCVEFERVCFSDAAHGVNWGEKDSTELRTLEDVNGDKVSVVIYPDALFSGYPLPEGFGRLVGIVTYVSGEYRILLSSPDDFIPDEKKL